MLIIQLNYLFLSEVVIKTFLYLISHLIYSATFNEIEDTLMSRLSTLPLAKNLQQVTPSNQCLVITDNLITL